MFGKTEKMTQKLSKMVLHIILQKKKHSSGYAVNLAEHGQSGDGLYKYMTQN